MVFTISNIAGHNLYTQEAAHHDTDDLVWHHGFNSAEMPLNAEILGHARHQETIPQPMAIAQSITSFMAT